MALPYSIDLTGSGSSIPVTGFGDFGTGVWSNAALPADRWGGSTATTIEFEAQGAGRLGAAQGELRINITGDADLTDELETARLQIKNGDTVLWQGILRDVDAAEPYVWRPGNAIVVGVLGSGATTITLQFAQPYDPINADPGTVSAGTPSATAGWEVAGPLPVNADPGTVSAAAPSASVSAEPARDPINADPGTVSAGSPTASLHAEGFSADPVNADPGTVSVPAPTASLRAGRRTATVNADPGTVSAASPTATLSAAVLDAAVDADPGTVSAGTPSASLRATTADFSVDARPGTVSAGSPRAALTLGTGSVASDFTADERAAQPRRRILTCAEFMHPALSAPVRLVNDTEDRVVAGQTYTAVRFEAKLADDAKRRAPRAEISVGNVGRELSEVVEESQGGAGGTVRLFQVLDVDGALPDWALTLDIMGITGDSQNVRISLGFDPLLGRPAVALRYDPQTAPGLF